MQANKTIAADRYILSLSRSCSIDGVRHLFGDQVEVKDSAIANQLVADGLATIISYEWDNGPVVNGASVNFRRN